MWEAGAGGDCLFHSFAAALEALILKDATAAAHVFERVPETVFAAGRRALVLHLRKLSASALDSWAPEALLDFALRAAVDYKLGSFEDQWSPHPLQMLEDTGFGILQHCESVQAFGDALEGEAGDTVLRLAFTDARRGGGGRREELVLVCQGRVKLEQLRSSIQAQIVELGNVHWGNQFDVNSLSTLLDLGVFMFCDSLQNGGRECLYNIGSTKNTFPYWIALWWMEPVHFRVLQVGYPTSHEDQSAMTFTTCWTQEELPAPLWREYERCNRLAN